MSQIETYTERGLAGATTTQDIAVQRLGEWAQSADAAYSVAQRLVESSFVPQAFRGKPVEATAAILAGIEVGLSPMAALRSFDVIQGQAAPRAITLRAVAQSQGHEIVLVESTATRCRMKGKRRGSDEWQTVVWTMDRARDLGLANKDGWKKQPQAMLVARATSELARLIASDAILGIGYSSEELADGGTLESQTAADTTAPSAAEGTRRMSRKPREERPAEPEPEAEDAPDSPYLNTSSALATAMFAALGDAGITDKADRLGYVSSVVGRTVESSTEMTEDDARAVLDALKQLADSEAVDAEIVPDPADGDDPWSAGQ